MTTRLQVDVQGRTTSLLFCLFQRPNLGMMTFGITVIALSDDLIFPNEHRSNHRVRTDEPTPSAGQL